jgi:two-component system, response regulator, stage 0 sporulation protein F
MMSVRPVLVIEDHADTRHMVEDFLNFEGIHTVGAENGLEGLSALRQHVPSLILLDLTMPVMDGWTFREQQRRLSDPRLADVPVVVISALNDSERHAKALGAVGVIPKPVDFDRMLSVVRQYYEPES